MNICDRCYPAKTELATDELIFRSTDEHKHLCEACMRKVKEALKPAPKRGRPIKEKFFGRSD